MPTGSRWNDTSLAGTVSKRATSYWITQRYHTSIPSVPTSPMVLTLYCFESIGENARSIWKTFTIARQQGWYMNDKDKVLVSAQLLLDSISTYILRICLGYVSLQYLKRLWKRCCYCLWDIIKIIFYISITIVSQILQFFELDKIISYIIILLLSLCRLLRYFLFINFFNYFSLL